MLAWLAWIERIDVGYLFAQSVVESIPIRWRNIFLCTCNPENVFLQY